MPPRSGIQCSRNSRWLTVAAPAAVEPRERRERPGGGGASRRLAAPRVLGGRGRSPAASARRRLRPARGAAFAASFTRRAPAGAGAAGACANATMGRATRRAACAARAASGSVGHGHCGRASGRLSRRFCGLSFRRDCGVHRHREVDRAARRSPGACRRDSRSRARNRHSEAPHPLLVDVDPIVQVVQERRSPRRRGRRATPTARRRSRAPGSIVTVDAQEMRDPALEHAAQRVERRAPAIQADRRSRGARRAPSTSAALSVVEHVEIDGARRRLVLPREARRGCRSRRSSRSSSTVTSSAAITAPSSQHGDLLRAEQHLGGARLASGPRARPGCAAAAPASAAGRTAAARRRRRPEQRRVRRLERRRRRRAASRKRSQIA